MVSTKPISVKPGLYTMFYEHLKQIAMKYGYNLLINGSMNRDLDLVAVPWIDNPKPEQDMIKDFQEYLTGRITITPENNVFYTILPGNRHSYVIELNRGNKKGEWNRFDDCEYYLDISVTQLGKIIVLDSKSDTIIDKMRDIDPHKLSEPYTI